MNEINKRDFQEELDRLFHNGIKIVSDHGSASSTRFFDAKTGDPIDLMITNIDLSCSVGGYWGANISVYMHDGDNGAIYSVGSRVEAVDVNAILGAVDIKAYPASVTQIPEEEAEPDHREICGNCRHFREVNDHGGSCRRYPPTLLFVNSDESKGWVNDCPFVKHDFDCGEWKDKNPVKT